MKKKSSTIGTTSALSKGYWDIPTHSRMKIALLLQLTACSLLISCGKDTLRSADHVYLKPGENYIDEVRDEDDFTGIVCEGKVLINIAERDDFHVQVHADKSVIDHLETEVEGSTLYIRTEKGYSILGTNISIDIGMPQLTSLVLDGDCRAKLGEFTTDKLLLVSSGDSRIEFDRISCESIDATIDGNSRIRLKGNTTTLRARISGDSNLEAEELGVREADISCRGKSDAEIQSPISLKAAAHGASTIEYKGKPRDLSVECSGASSIKKKGN